MHSAHNEMAAALRRLAEKLASDLEKFGAVDAAHIHGIADVPLHKAPRTIPGADRESRLLVPDGTDAPRIVSASGSGTAAPRFFTTADEAHAYGTRIWGATAARLTPAQRELLWNYTRGDSTLINDFLREGFPLGPGPRGQAEGLDEIVRMRTTPEWIRVTKTIQARRLVPDRDIADVTPGYRGTFRDFVSTSMYPDGVNGLKNVEGRNVDVAIDVPPGTPAFYVGDLSATPEEAELLVARELDFDLSDLRPDGSRWQAAVTILPP
ncbi:ADP-ribosyltransferase [Nocardia sp. NPDC003963]